MARASLVAAALALAGCSGGGVPVERQAVVPGGQFAAVQGEARLTVRTFLPEAADLPRREVLGAGCTAVSSLYRTELVTPSRLVVPNFGAQSPAITIDCRAGELAGSGTVEVETFWRSQPGYWGYAGYPGFGPWGGGPWGGWYDGPGYPVSDYPDLAVWLAPRIAAD